MAPGVCFYVFVVWAILCSGNVADTSPTAELTVADGVVPTTGSNIQLVCLIDGHSLSSTVSLYKSSRSGTLGTRVVYCSSTSCSRYNFRYAYKRNSTGLFMNIITPLSRAYDQAWWTCYLDQARPTTQSLLFLQVYTSPGNVRYVDQSPLATGPIDLALQNFTAECRAEKCAYPAPEFVWFYITENGTRPPFDMGTQVEGQDGTECAATDEKYYSSTLTNPQFTAFPGLRSYTVTFVSGMNNTVTGWMYTPESAPVTFPYGPVIKRDDFKTKILTEGDASHTLYCSAESNPPSTFTWYKEGVAMPLKQKVGTMSDNSLSFTLVNVTRDDAGQYRCTADNGVSQGDEATLHIVVKYAAEVTEMSPPGLFEVGSDVTLTCKVDTGPVGIPNVTWFRQGVMAPLQTDSVSTSELVIAAIQCDQMSNYICCATNDMGTDERMVEVLVKCPPRWNPIVPLHQNVSAASGSTISLAIHVISFRLPVFTWRQPDDGISLISPQKLDQLDEGRSSRLTITDLQVFGEYTVTASNGILPDTVIKFNVYHAGTRVSRQGQSENTSSVGVIVGTALSCLVMGAVVMGLIFRFRNKCKCTDRCLKPMYMDAKPQEEGHSYSDASIELPVANIVPANMDMEDQLEVYENI